jgi:DNA-binding transcriptional LysR family regulator
MNLKHIEAFRAVMVAGSMTSAAKELFTSQPNVSRLISQLERETGLMLFQRTGARLVPTSEGTAFFREVERAYVGLQGLANAAAQIRNLGTGRLRIATVPSAGLTLVPRAIDRFQRLHPGVTVSLHVNTSSTVNHWTASQFCDLGVAVYVSEASTCEVELLSNLAAVCVLPAGHPLAKKSVIKPADLQGESFISRWPRNRGAVLRDLLRDGALRDGRDAHASDRRARLHRTRYRDPALLSCRAVSDVSPFSAAPAARTAGFGVYRGTTQPP